MAISIDSQIKKWQERLLDLGKRNRLINFRETKRSDLKVLSPKFDELILWIDNNNQPLLLRNENSKPIISKRNDQRTYVETGLSPEDQQKNLRNLRYRAKTSMEEQGVNVLFLCLGFLEWTEPKGDQESYRSPILLVPVSLKVESSAEPYELTRHEDEIVFNPTLAFKLKNEFGITIPDFVDSEYEISEYFDLITNEINVNGWEIKCEAGLSILSFLKINIYNDLEENKNKIAESEIILALQNSESMLSSVPEDLKEYSHDHKTHPIDTYQVLDADSYQLDAIMYAKRGYSFVLQGPPGTGKSQTITNIISECLAEGKKVLFVSEKMAALDVVFQRLTNTQLDRFCLPLHSHRANKKDVIQELGKCMYERKQTNLRDAENQLSELFLQRESLNRYASELHSTIFPLGITLFEGNGKLAKFADAPELSFEFPEVVTISKKQYQEILLLINELADAANLFPDGVKNSPWCDSKISTLSFNNRANIGNKLSNLIDGLEQIVITYAKQHKQIELPKPISFTTIREIIDIYSLFGDSPKIPINWVSRDDLEIVEKESRQHLHTIAEYTQVKEKLQEKYSDNYFSLPASQLESDIFDSLVVVKTNINRDSYPTDKIIIQEINALLELLIRFKDTFSKSISLSENLTSYLDLAPVDSFSQLINVSTLVNAIDENPEPINNWFEWDFFENVPAMLDLARVCFNEKINARESLLAEFDEEILKLNYLPILKRFKTDYSGFPGSLFKFLKPQYWSDRNEFKFFSKSETFSLSDSSIIKILTNLKEYETRSKWIEEKNSEFHLFFGSHFNGESTDWIRLEKSITNFSIVRSFFGKNLINDKVKNILQSSRQLDKATRKSNHELIEIIDSSFQNNLSTFFIKEFANADYSLGKQLKTISELIQFANLISTSYKELHEYDKQSNSFETSIDALHQLKILQVIEHSFDQGNIELRKKYDFYFTGLSTDWKLVSEALIWALQFNNALALNDFSPVFVKKIADKDTVVDILKKLSVDILNIFADIKDDWNWYISEFDNPENISQIEIHNLINRITAGNNLDTLANYINYRKKRMVCFDNGLKKYVEEIEASSLNPDNFDPSFQKRFYSLWIDHFQKNYPAVWNFRADEQNAKILKFQELDNSQKIIASARITNIINKTLPNPNSITSAKDEVAILKKEIAKSRRIKPLRKLFQEIPSLLQTLKPCLMMSPLSVSLYLASASLKFDLVIFDEASQVFIEDAVGSILRGSQVIIAGDKEQLPPTSFFQNTLTSDDLFDIEDDEELDESESFESILDQANSVLNQCSLQWHYRSRHEDLIAFSNAKIYENRLITFPSHIQKSKNEGVEYVYVSDGIYDRGNTKTNRKEAEKVIELILQHLRETPERSLGVVTFNQAQQSLIEKLQEEKLLQNPELNEFFSATKNEPFFIKNLENVQGDERDTIILSICYGKDSTGLLRLNFGPINKAQGYRRLNVAITRAKYNLKLVGSIHYSEIKLGDTPNKGVKILQDYIEYAQEGPKVLEIQAAKGSDIPTFDSDFEESVYDVLVKNGFEVRTQIGCSGYRIDLGVLHPEHKNKFVLGIECDGRTYHSTRTARERDRLRQDLLEGLGWTIYRIWSTDWIRNQKIEELKLIEFVKQSISRFENKPQKHEEVKPTQEKEEKYLLETVTPELVKSVIQNNVNPFKFAYYREAKIKDVDLRNIRYSDRNPTIIGYIVNIEGPIHVKVLGKKLVSLYDRSVYSSEVAAGVARDLTRLRNYLKRDGAYLINPSKPIIPRIPIIGEKRDIEYIHPEELALMLYAIASHGVGILKSDLFTLTVKQLGFNRRTEKMSPFLEKSLSILKLNGKVKVENEKVLVKK